MSLRSGHRLGPYEIVKLVGAGGMGEVYRARDTRLDRVVAIKVISSSHGNDDKRRRFEREAQAISRLNHPHICTLYDVGVTDGVAFLVMEFVEGQTLAEHLTKSRLQPPEVIALAIEIGEALASAHRMGIVHRDLKPGNIMLTASGVKLLDFGLAKLTDPASPMVDAATHAQSITGQGTIIGTLQYMAPEQLEGKESDIRTDVFAFGAVVYEMATGRKAFTGDSQASLITSIMSAEPPPLTELAPVTPATLDRVVRKCLKKDPDRRWQSARDLVDALTWISPSTTNELAPAPDRFGLRASRVAWTAAAVFAATAAVFAAMWMRQPASETPVSARFTLPLPTPESIRGAEIRSEIATSLALSPNGRQLAFTVMSGGRSQLWLRSLDDPTFKAIAGTEGAFSPFWSPDSRFIGFGAEGKIKMVELTGGAPRVIANVGFEYVPTWNQFGTILFAPDMTTQRGLMRVDTDGGAPVEVTQLDPAKGILGHGWPHFLPDGQHFLYQAFVAEGPGQFKWRLLVGSLDGGEPRIVSVSGSSASTTPVERYSRTEYADGHLLFANDGTLLAQPFDLNAFRLSGQPTVVAEQIRGFKPTGAASFSLSGNGVLAFETVRNHSPNLAWFDRSGNELTTLKMPGPIKSVRLSPNGQRLAVDIVDTRTGISDIWIQDVNGGVPRRFLYMPNDEVAPIWLAGSDGLVFRSDLKGPPDIHQKAVEGSGNEVVVFAALGVQHPLDVAPGNKHLLYLEEDRITRADLYLLRMTEAAKPEALLRTPFEERDGVFSPDGYWIAFESDESGAPEIYVMPIDAVGSRRRVSFAGGQTPRWRRDGSELFYVAPDGAMMSVAVSKGMTLQAPQRLFSMSRRIVNSNYDVSPDGQRFLINIGEPESTPITVVMNWKAAKSR